jgi:uncharacterized ParB-like nuclease family protein
LKNFAGLPFDLKAGRQEIILDAHRLFGNTLWTMGAHSHDAIRLNHKHDNMTFSYGFIQQAEQQDSTADETTDNTREAGDNDDTEDVTTQFLYANFAGILGGKLSTMYIYTADGCGGKTGKATCSGGANDIHTIGFRQAGQLFGLDYRGEYYYQFGDAQGIASATTNGDAVANPNQTNGFMNTGADVDRKAYMFGVRVGKQFKNVGMKPKLTLWYDYLSGTSDEDGKNNEWKSFSTVYDTGHKFYGLQDVFLGLGNNSCGAGTCGLGLSDAAIKAQISPVPGWTVKADYHWMYTAEGVGANKRRAGTATGIVTDSSELGQELDVTVVNKYNANTKIMLGYSHFMQGPALSALRPAYGNDDANWFYTQIHVGF